MRSRSAAEDNSEKQDYEDLLLSLKTISDQGTEGIDRLTREGWRDFISELNSGRWLRRRVLGHLESWKPWVEDFETYSGLLESVNKGLLRFEAALEEAPIYPEGPGRQRQAGHEIISSATQLRSKLDLWVRGLYVLQVLRRTPNPPVPLGLGFLVEISKQENIPYIRAFGRQYVSEFSEEDSPHVRDFREARRLALAGLGLIVVASAAVILLQIGWLPGASAPGPWGTLIVALVLPAVLVGSYFLTVKNLVDAASAVNEYRISRLKRAIMNVRLAETRLSRDLG